MSDPVPDLPVDEPSRARLAEQGLAFAVLDTADRAAFAAWHQSVSRGFLNPVSTDERIDQAQAYAVGDRLVGVWDPTAADPVAPVATSQTWVTDLTVPGRTTVPAWAISAVTVAQTHRRRGIARALLEAELRTASALELPVAMLTVSESTIYGRYGFAPAVLARDLTIDTRRVRWTGPQAAPGRVHYVTADDLHEAGHAIVERVRLEAPGQIHYPRSSSLWERQLGLPAGDDASRALRFVRYDDPAGTPQGFAIYTVKEDEADFTQSRATVQALVAATPEAYAALWRFVLELDLVATVTAPLRPVDEPLRWMVGDFRSMHVDERDHLWTRIIDVPRALEARTYGAAGRLVLDVRDDLRLAAGTWALEVDASGVAEARPVTEQADVTLSVAALSALHLGGTSARMLSAAGSLQGDADGIDAIFRSPVAPYLGIWF
jgi:predicted acetyltransferase